MQTVLANGLITLIDDKPELGFHDLVEEALSWVSDVVWDQLLKGRAVRLALTDSISRPAWAEGKWRRSDRTALVRRMYNDSGKPRANRVRYTAIHELAGHGSDSSSLDAQDRADIMDLMMPRPSGWTDDDNLEGMAAYWRLPYESYANRLVEALVGRKITSPYDDDYTRKIPDTRLGALRDIALRSTPVPVPPVDEPIEEPPPTPLELELMQALEAANARLTIYDAQTLKASEALWRPEWGTFPPPEVGTQE